MDDIIFIPTPYGIFPIDPEKEIEEIKKWLETPNTAIKETINAGKTIITSTQGNIADIINTSQTNVKDTISKIADTGKETITTITGQTAQAGTQIGIELGKFLIIVLAILLILFVIVRKLGLM